MGSNPEGGLITMKSGQTRHMFSKPSSPRYIVGDRATTVNNDSVYYDGGGISGGNNT